MWEEGFSLTINSSPEAGEIVVLFSGHERTLPLHHVGPRVLDYYLVHYCMSGKGWCRTSYGKQTLTPGDSFFTFPGVLSEYCSDKDEPWRYCWIAFRGSLAEEWMKQLDVTPERPVLASDQSRKLVSLFHAVYRSLEPNQGAAGAIEAGGYFRLIFAEWLRNAPLQPEPQRQLSEAELQVERAVQWLTLQYAQPKSITQLAKELGYHRTYFSKLFRDAVGMPPQQFLQNVRMERAKELLMQQLTIEQVASSVGFPDALYFSRQFKRRFGISPSEYRTNP